MDTKKLRQKILDLAIRGKLVPQDPNDEPASVLLERIRAEKERLIAEGKIKRPKKSKASSAESHYQNFEPPFPIPDSWEWVRLEEVCKSIAAGGDKPIDFSKDKTEKNTVPIFSNGIENDGLYGYTDKATVNEKSITISARGTIGFCKKRTEPYVPIIRLLVVIPSELLSIDYLLLAISSLITAGEGSSIPQLTVPTIKEVYLPLPPYFEQINITKEFDKITTEIETINKENIQLSSYIKIAKSKILDLAMQGKLVPQDSADEPAADMLLRINPKAKIITDNPHYPQLPDNWVLTRLGDVVKVINGKSQKEVENLSGSYPIYGSGGIIGMADTYSCLSGSTIIGRKGTISNPQFIETNFWNVDTAFGMKPNEAVDDLYFYYFCKSFDFKTLDKSSTLPSLTKSAIEAITLPIPPLNEQLRIISKIKEYDGLFSNIIKQIGQK